MSNNADNDQTPNDSFYDMNGSVVEINNNKGSVQLWAWRITEDSRGRLHQTSADTVDLTPRKAIELARRLFIAATE